MMDVITYACWDKKRFWCLDEMKTGIVISNLAWIDHLTISGVIKFRHRFCLKFDVQLWPCQLMRHIYCKETPHPKLHYPQVHVRPDADIFPWSCFHFNTSTTLQGILHNDVIKWIHFPRYWPFVLGIHQSPVNSPKNKWYIVKNKASRKANVIMKYMRGNIKICHKALLGKRKLIGKRVNVTSFYINSSP